MCGKCDDAYYRFIHREDSKGTFLQFLVMMAVAIVPAVISTALLPITIATCFLGFPSILWWRKAADKRKFLTMMRTRGALPETDKGKPSADEEALARYQAKINDRRAETLQATFDVGESNSDPDAPK
jgi:hypothetical protein